MSEEIMPAVGMQWFYSKNGAQQGPVSLEELRAKIASGDVSSTDLIWKEGMADWTAAGRVAEFVTPSSPVGSSVESGVENVEAYQKSPYSLPQSPVVTSAVAAPSGGGKALASLILGICAIVFSFLCPPISFIISIPSGILALLFSRQFKKSMETNPDLALHSGKATAGFVTGLIGLICTVLVIFVLIVFWASPANRQQFEESFEKARMEQMQKSNPSR